MIESGAGTWHPARSADVDQAFVELVYSDEELLDAAFEAIIAAEWEQPPKQPTPLPSPLPSRSNRPAPRVSIVDPPLPSRHPGVAGGATARSPPPRWGDSGP